METASKTVTDLLIVCLLIGQISGGSTDCATGWTKSQDSCFKIFQVDEVRKQTLNWNAAAAYCRERNATLASFSNQEQETFVFRATRLRWNTNVWIGLNDISTEGVYNWSDGSALTYFNWAYNRNDDAKDCAARAFHRWQMKPCGDFLPAWICKIPKGVTPLTVPPPPPPDYCYENDTSWLNYGDNTCYFFSTALSVGTKTWTESREYCRSVGGELLSLHDANETSWIMSRLELETRRGWWIGLREYGFDRHFRWSDGTPLDYENWHKDEPNDYYGEEGCVHIARYSDNATWNDNHCAVKFSFICKKFNHSVDPITHPPTTPMPGPCPRGWTEFDYKCYKFFGLDDVNERRNWSAARTACKSLRSHLATVHTREIQKFIYSKIAFAQSGIWIGLRKARRQLPFRWSDGEATMSYTNWGNNQPYIYGMTCVEVSEGSGQWRKERCNSESAWLCKGEKDVEPQPEDPTKPDDKACIAGYTYYNGGCYKAYKNPQTFQQASMQCRKDGGNLASLMNAFEEAFVETLAYIQGFPLWIGMELNNETEEYEWRDGSPLFYTGWKSVRIGVDADGGYTNSCVKATKDGWEATNCDELLGAICKIYIVPPPSTPEHIEGHCGVEVGWIPYGSDCYFFGDKGRRVGAQQAQFNCMQRDSTLVTIHHDQESQFILSQLEISQDIWIGLVKGHGGFRWIDNSPLQFARWAVGQPDHVDDFGTEDCVVLQRRNGDWDDQRCSNLKGYVCKKPKIVLTTTMTSITELGEKKQDSTGVNISTIILIVEAVIVVVVVIPVIVWRIHKRRQKLAAFTTTRFIDVAHRFHNTSSQDNISTEGIIPASTEEIKG
ncbi:macrophage mannose receptor 1-like isoform X1 [Ptychodera flava]|uniref:macrophage mannose receptor 1-like isoform X1 n=1 Tax=Ptychodera flava TaxID=63121 RepID=UPI00396A1009